ncbi:MAG: polyprenyl synthetase family protein [Clostridia bacterium]|nr:polyprenyl synthetase family protein [Clostridia bacterium]
MAELGFVIKQNAEMTEKAMNKAFDRAMADRSHYEKLERAMKYSAFAGGKRIRPFLTLEFYKAVSGSGDVTKALDYAAAVELIHTSSLIHDDLPAMDNDDFRRGKPSNHKAFGEATAILAGDALITLAIETIALNDKCSAEQNVKAVAEFCRYSGLDGMMGGQQIDLNGEGYQLRGEEVEQMHLFKTGALMSCACVLGCIAAGADEEKIQAARDFGASLGMAFQIKDDILDVESTSIETGKTVGKDKIYQKSTFVSCFGLEESHRQAEAYSAKAEECLSAFGDTETVAELKELCEYLLGRNK